jgi:peptidoglycan/xylan/chitin deacetylase (PgdA/CDA1 family)
MNGVLKKFTHLSHRFRATYKFRNLHTLKNKVPLISFTFDDFPKSAALKGADILKRYNVQGTYYISLGILGQRSPVGEICDIETIKNLITEKHEIGSHTYDHISAYQYPVDDYEKSILTNEKFYKDTFLTSVGFQNFSYPLGNVTTGTKRITEKYFRTSRTVYRGINIGKVDLNMLKAYPICGNVQNLPTLKTVIDHNIKKNGWLIFYTHDVSENPSPYGCTPEYLEKVVKYSVESGAELVTVTQACDYIAAPLKNKIVQK